MYYDEYDFEERREKRLTQSLLLPLISAFLLWLASPGDVGLWPVTFVALVPLLFFLEAAAAKPLSAKRTAGAGLLSGMVLFSALLYWIVKVLKVFGGLPLPVAVVALLLLAFYMSLYVAAFFLGVRCAIRALPPMALLLFIPALQAGLEWLRGVAFTGFPWMDIGNFFAMQPQLIQPASVVGHSGLTAMAVFINTGLWLLLSSALPLTKKWQPAVAVAAGVGLYAAVSLLPAGEKAGALRVAIIQGNVAQEMKWEASAVHRTLVNYMTLSKGQLHGDEPQLFVWPETAVPFFPNSSPLGEKLVQFVDISGVPLLTGSPWSERFDSREQKRNYYNAALLLVPEKGLGGLNFKSHLVPFGEYVPLQKLLFFLGPLVEAAGNFTPGRIEHPLVVPLPEQRQARIGTLICYESVFPELSRAWVDVGANLLVNITNDAWFGRTSAPKHILAMTVMRAVETRRAVVRAANTGYSGVILPDGRISGRTDLFVPAAETIRVPLNEGRTLFVRFGWLFGPLALLFSCVVVVVAVFRGKRVEENEVF